MSLRKSIHDALDSAQTKQDQDQLIDEIFDLIDAAGWQLMPKEPTEEMWKGWRSVNCTIGRDGMEEFTYFSGDYGNWLACWNAMREAAPKPE